MKYRLEYTTKFKKSYKRMMKRGLKREEFQYVVEKIQNGEKLERKYKDHLMSNSKAEAYGI